MKVGDEKFISYVCIWGPSIYYVSKERTVSDFATFHAEGAKDNSNYGVHIILFATPY